MGLSTVSAWELIESVPLPFALASASRLAVEVEVEVEVEVVPSLHQPHHRGPGLGLIERWPLFHARRLDFHQCLNLQPGCHHF